MNIEFNYRTVHFYLLSLFGILLILSLTNVINSNFTNTVRNYSIFGIIFCTLAWIAIEQIYDKVKHIHPKYNYQIQKWLSYRVMIHWALFAILFLGFIFYVVISPLQNPIPDLWNYTTP